MATRPTKTKFWQFSARVVGPQEATRPTKTRARPLEATRPIKTKGQPFSAWAIGPPEVVRPRKIGARPFLTNDKNAAGSFVIT